MATHSSILAWKIPWSEEAGGLQSMWVTKEFGHNLATKQQQHHPFVRVQAFDPYNDLVKIILKIPT